MPYAKDTQSVAIAKPTVCKLVLPPFGFYLFKYQIEILSTVANVTQSKYGI